MPQTSPACYGCYVNPAIVGLWADTFNPSPDPFINDAPVNGLTFEEKEILGHLASAWDKFSALEQKHPDDNSDFLRAIHQAQQLIALRVARRVDLDVWSQPTD